MYFDDACDGAVDRVVETRNDEKLLLILQKTLKLTWKVEKKKLHPDLIYILSLVNQKL